VGVVDDVTAAVRDVVETPFSTRVGIVVPESQDVALQNGAVQVDATYLYADLADSSKAAQVLKQEVTAKIIRAYLNAATRVLRHYNGAIRSFDGDRVMAVFLGTMKNTNAARAALGINWAVEKVVRPKINTQWTDLKDYWALNHGVGIATGNALMVRGGVRNNNDLVSIGEAPNVAAKLSELRGTPSTYVTYAVHGALEPVAREFNGQNMWIDYGTQTIGGKVFKVAASTWWSSP